MQRLPRAPVVRKKKSNAGVTAFASLVGVAFFSIPFVAHYLKRENYQQKDGPLNVTQIRRGPYQNTGSKDVGVDKDWDFSTYTWRGKRGKDYAQEKAAKQASRKPTND